MKAMSIRMNDLLGKKFNHICQREGFNKNAVLVRLIDAFVLSRTGYKASKRKSDAEMDPFLKVIGIYDGKPFNLKEGEIDDEVGYQG
jgi:hypothetical protein